MSSKKALFSTLSAMSEILLHKDEHLVYYEAFQDFREMLDAKTKLNLCSNTQNDNWIDYDLLRKYCDGRIDSLKRIPQSLFILALFVYRPPRRALDYACMKLVQRIPIDIEPYNYLVVDENKILFVFIYYKTAWRYGDQIFTLDNENPLYSIIRRMLHNKQLMYNAPILPNLFSRYRDPSAIADLLSQETKSCFPNKRLTPTIMRSIVATKRLSNNMSYADIEKLAYAMGTSPKMLLSVYRKIDQM